MGPAQRIRILGSADVLPRTVDRYIMDATHANFLKQAKGPSRGWNLLSASTPLFANSEKLRLFSVREEVVLQWSIMFNNTATPGNYGSLLEK